MVVDKVVDMVVDKVVDKAAGKVVVQDVGKVAALVDVVDYCRLADSQEGHRVQGRCPSCHEVASGILMVVEWQ